MFLLFNPYKSKMLNLLYHNFHRNRTLHHKYRTMTSPQDLAGGEPA